MARIGGWTEVISDELRNWGLAPDVADSFACEYVVHLPLSPEAGTTLLSKRLRDLGLADDQAQEAAATLFAVSLFSTRRNLGQVRQLLGKAGVGSSTALGAAMDASRIRREITKSIEEGQPAFGSARLPLGPALVFSAVTALLLVIAG